MTNVLKKQKFEQEKRILKLRLHKEKLPEGLISDDMRQFIELSESDPAPNIGAEFDWHFQGGNLETLEIDGKFFVAQPSMCDQYAVRLLKPSSTFMQIDLETKSKCLNKNYSYELMSSDDFIGIRRRKTVNFIDRWNMLIDEFEVPAPIEFKWSSEIVASTLNKGHLIFIDDTNKLISSKIARMTIDSDIKLQNDVPQHQFPVSIDTLDKNVVSYTNLKTLNLVDLRDEKVITIFDKKNFLMNCEELSYHKKSLQYNLLYLASSHLLYGIDLRKPNGLLMHWNHQLIMQPTILKQVMYDKHEVICLSSNQQGDLKIFNCAQESKENSWSINWTPLKPRNVKQSYQKMKEKGLLLLSEPVKQRVNLSTTGVAMISNLKHRRIKMFTQNSFGDVFKSYLLCNTEDAEKDTRMVQSFEEWGKGLETQPDPLKFLPFKERIERKELIFSDVVRLNGLAKVMRCDKLLQSKEKEPETAMITRKIPLWKTSIEEAKEYRDVLSKLILNEWDLQIEDSQPVAFAEALKENEIEREKGADKVSRWLETTSVDDNLMTIKEEDESSRDTADDVLFTPMATSTQDVEVPKKKMKLSQKVKGF